MLAHVIEHCFRLPAGEVGVLLDRYRWPNDARRRHVMIILRKTLEAVAEFRGAVDAAVLGSRSAVLGSMSAVLGSTSAVLGSASLQEVGLTVQHSHGRLIQTIEGVLDEHAKRADPSEALGGRIFRAVADCAIEHAAEAKAAAKAAGEEAAICSGEGRGYGCGESSAEAAVKRALAGLQISPQPPLSSPDLAAKRALAGLQISPQPPLSRLISRRCRSRLNLPLSRLSSPDLAALQISPQPPLISPDLTGLQISPQPLPPPPHP